LLTREAFPLVRDVDRDPAALPARTEFGRNLVGNGTHDGREAEIVPVRPGPYDGTLTRLRVAGSHPDRDLTRPGQIGRWNAEPQSGAVIAAGYVVYRYREQTLLPIDERLDVCSVGSLFCFPPLSLCLLASSCSFALPLSAVDLGEVSRRDDRQCVGVRGIARLGSCVVAVPELADPVRDGAALEEAVDESAGVEVGPDQPPFNPRLLGGKLYGASAHGQPHRLVAIGRLFDRPDLHPG
jgi:hypothetical protein